MRFWQRACVALLCALISLPAAAQEDAGELAKKLVNPISNLISMPFQGNYDCCFGAANGSRWTTNVQPVVPLKLDEDWNLIVRTIVPVIYAQPTSSAIGSQFGLGDTLQSFFFSPQRPTANGLIWGIGPALLYPTGTARTLGSRKLGAGPTVVALKQEYGWTYGTLVNQIWSFAEVSNNSSQVNSIFFQPFVAYTTPAAFTVTVDTESTYDWTRHQLSAPINLLFSQVFKIGNQPVSFQVGPRYYAATFNSGPRWGARFNFTLLFPVGN